MVTLSDKANGVQGGGGAMKDRCWQPEADRNIAHQAVSVGES
jgi:hypothetical protein